MTNTNPTPVITVPAFRDNYIWLICDSDKSHAAIVDPGEAAPVLRALQENNIQPVAILLTHFHYDHVNGVKELLTQYPGLPVYGPEVDRAMYAKNPNRPEYGPADSNILRITRPLKGNETFSLDKLNPEFQTLQLPGHTAGHIAYYLDNGKERKLFCGDTLFAVGCGRIFNGTLRDLHDSLQTIKQLPSDTLVYCAHEYTLDNIGFAKWVEPENTALLTREERDMAMIDTDQATVPFLLADELKTNPFLRTHLQNIKEKAEAFAGKPLDNEADIFAALRTWKDTEYD